MSERSTTGEELRASSALADRAAYATAVESLRQVDEEIADINNSLAAHPTLRIVTNTDFLKQTSAFAYDPASDSAAIVCEITTAGKGFVFFGNRLVVVDEHVVVVDTDAGYGIPYRGLDAGRFVDTADINSWQQKDHEYLVRRFSEIEPGTSVSEDHIYP